MLELDIVWPGVLAPHLLDLGSPQDLEAEGHFPSAVASFTVASRLRAVPWYLSVGRLLYRTDLLERYGLKVPTSWEELAAAARTIQEGERAAGNAGFWGFLWQGRVGEGLTANALEWITSAGAPGSPGAGRFRSGRRSAQLHRLGPGRLVGRHDLAGRSTGHGRGR